MVQTRPFFSSGRVCPCHKKFKKLNISFSERVNKRFFCDILLCVLTIGSKEDMMRFALQISPSNSNFNKFIRKACFEIETHFFTK